MATYGYGENYGQDWGGARIVQFADVVIVPGVRFGIEPQIIGVGGVFAGPNVGVGGVEVVEGD